MFKARFTDGSSNGVLVGLSAANIERFHRHPLHTFNRIDAAELEMPFDLMLVAGNTTAEIMAMIAGRPLDTDVAPKRGCVRARMLLAGRPTLLVGLSFATLADMVAGGYKRFNRRPGIPLSLLLFVGDAAPDTALDDLISSGAEIRLTATGQLGGMSPPPVPHTPAGLLQPAAR